MSIILNHEKLTLLTGYFWGKFVWENLKSIFYEQILFLGGQFFQWEKIFILGANFLIWGILFSWRHIRVGKI